MPVYKVPRDPPPYGLSFEAIVLYDLEDAEGAFDAYVDMSRDYSTWFTKSSAGLIVGYVPVSGGKVLEGTVRAKVAIRVEWRARVETAEARVADFEALFTAREAYS